jgi:hypothetical protein
MKNSVRVSVRVIVLVLLAMVAGCGARQTANNNVGTYGFTKPEQAVSIQHPVEYEKAGENYVTVFTAILDAGVWGVESIDGVGVWPILAERNGPKPFVGYAFTESLNAWGQFTIQGVIVGRLSEIENAKAFQFNRAAKKIYDLIGGKQVDYDPDKFDSDLSYRASVFQKGTTLNEVSAFWKKYYQNRGFDNIPGTVFEEIAVGSVRWEEFKMELESRMKVNYTMPNGEIRLGFLSVKGFQEETAKNNGTTAGQRFMRNAFIPVGDPVTMAIGSVASILNGLVAASNAPLTGFYDTSEALRGDLKSNFRLMQTWFQKLLYERDVAIFNQYQQILELEAQLASKGRKP